MNDASKKNNLLKNIQILVTNNLRNIIIIIILLFTAFIIFQSYNYYSIQQIKKSSIKFFNSIEGNEEIINDINEIKKENNIFSTLSILKLIEINNEEKKFDVSNDLYKEIIQSNKLNNIYKSTIAAHASYTLINASYLINTNIYLNDISNYIDSISDELESYFSIKKELKFLLLITEIDLNRLDYKNNSKILNMYNEIIKSNLVSSSVKERVKKIHEFQLYK